MKKLDLTCLLNHIWNVLNKGLFKMETTAVVLITIALYLGAYGSDIKKDIQDLSKTEQTQEKK